MTKNRNFELVRTMGDYEVVQRTMDGMFNANALLKQWNETTGNKRRKMSEFLNSPKTKEFMEELAKDMQVTDNQQMSKTDLPNNQLVSIIKGRTSKKGEKTPDKVWMHPLLFIDFAMYLNPRFKVQVLKFVYDQLIEFRNGIADSYKGWTSVLNKLGASTPEDYQRVQKCMNYAVFGRHQDGIRNTANTDQLTRMTKYEEEICRLVEFGMISNLEGVRKYLRKIWEKNYPTPFTECEEIN